MGFFSFFYLKDCITILHYLNAVKKIFNLNSNYNSFGLFYFWKDLVPINNKHNFHQNYHNTLESWKFRLMSRTTGTEK